METKERRTNVVVSLLVLAGLVVFGLTAIGGDLEPTAPPGSTMKTLDEVEPRIPIPASATPVAPFYINNPGSYYLTGDRTASSNGIVVEANDVTIDLMGYTLKGPGSGNNVGIHIDRRRNVEICNGTVRSFGLEGVYGVRLDDREHRVIGVRAVSNGRCGIRLSGKGHLIKDCSAAENGDHGIHVGFGYGCTVTGNTCYDNDGRGIWADDGCTVTGNTAYGNTNYGIYAYRYCLVDQNTAYGNGTNMYTGTGCVLGTNCAP